MLACLPASGYPVNRLLSHTQMNTGLQKWETTQKMRSVKYPTPAELDAYAKKVANNPLTIKIFPNSVKVPQRKHIRRTVNGLDTSTSSQRHSPYQSQVGAKAGLLAVLRVPAKSIVKEVDGSRARLLSKSTMNPLSGQYVTQSTLNIPQPVPHLQGLSQTQVMAAQKPGLPHPQAFQQPQRIARPMTSQQPQTMSHHPTLQQRHMVHPQVLQRQQSLSQLQTLQQQSLAHPQSIQRQQSLPHTQTLQKQQSQPRPQTLQQHQTLPDQLALLQHQGVAPGMRHMSDATQQPSLPNSQVLPPSQSLPQAASAGPPSAPNALPQQQPVPGPYGPRKLPDADAPPNVTVSTSTIPLSMAASLHQNRPSDLSSIVLQINQFCQARASVGGTSVCEGQIANPSPISRNLLISASSRVSTHNPSLGPLPSCLLGGDLDSAPPHTPATALPPQPNMAAIKRMPAFHSDIEHKQLQQLQQQQQQLQQQQQQQLQQQQQQLQQQLQQQQQQLQQQHHQQLHQQQQQQQQLQQKQQLQLQQQQQQQQQRSWNQHQLAHMQQAPEGAHPCKNPRIEAPPGPGFPAKNLSYPHKLCASQSFPLRHSTDKPSSSPPDMPFTNGHYMQPAWSGVLPGPNNNGSGPPDLPRAFQGAQGAPALDCTPGPQFRGGPPAQIKLMQNVEYLGGEFQAPCFREQNLGVTGKMHRPQMGRAAEPSNGQNIHSHHPGYR